MEAPTITGGEIVGASRLSPTSHFGVLRRWGDLTLQTAVSRDTRDDASPMGSPWGSWRPVQPVSDQVFIPCC